MATHVLIGTCLGTCHGVVVQDSPGFSDGAEGSDRFGAALAACNFDGDGYSDLAVGAPGEDLGGVLSAGYEALSDSCRSSDRSA